MSDVNLGESPSDDAQRDAVHVAVVPLIAGEKYMCRGQRFRLAHDSTTVALCGEYNEGTLGAAIGIVNPFRKGGLKKGDRFWGFLFPGTVTGMRHEWKHPAFNDIPSPSDNPHEKWIRDFCDRWNFDYGQLIKNATATGGDEFSRYVVARGKDLHYASELGGDYELFWQHLEQLLGKQYTPEHRSGLAWSCTC